MRTKANRTTIETPTLAGGITISKAYNFFSLLRVTTLHTLPFSHHTSQANRLARREAHRFDPLRARVVRRRAVSRANVPASGLSSLATSLNNHNLITPHNITPKLTTTLYHTLHFTHTTHHNTQHYNTNHQTHSARSPLCATSPHTHHHPTPRPAEGRATMRGFVELRAAHGRGQRRPRPPLNVCLGSSSFFSVLPRAHAASTLSPRIVDDDHCLADQRQQRPLDPLVCAPPPIPPYRRRVSLILTNNTITYTHHPTPLSS